MRKLLFAILLALMANTLIAYDYYATIVVFNKAVPVYSDSTGLDTILSVYQLQIDGSIDSGYDVKLLEKSSARFKVIVNNDRTPLCCAHDSVGWVDKQFIGRFQHGYTDDVNGYFNILYDQPDVNSRKHYLFVIPETAMFVDDYDGDNFYKVHFWADGVRFEGWMNKFDGIYVH